MKSPVFAYDPGCKLGKNSRFMTWAEACDKGGGRWLLWIAICSVLACCFLVKGGTGIELLWAALIGAANGIAVGFAMGPAAEKGAAILSGLLAGTPFYFIGISILVLEATEAQSRHRNLPRDVFPLVAMFLAIAVLFSLAQALRVRKQTNACSAESST